MIAPRTGRRPPGAAAARLAPGRLGHALAVLLLAGCGEAPADRRPLSASEAPIHLEDHLDAARLVGAEIPADVPAPREWRFDRPRPDWKPAAAETTVLRLTPGAEALRVDLAPAAGAEGGLWGLISTDLDDWHPGDWDYVLVRARARGGIRRLGLKLNRRPEAGDEAAAWRVHAEEVDAVNDGAFQTYLMRLGIRVGEPAATWRQLAIHFSTAEAAPATLEIDSVRVIPSEARYLDAAGRGQEGRGGDYRRVLYTRAPARLTYRLQAPRAGRLDVGLGVLREDFPVTFRVRARPPGGDAAVLLEETWGDRERWRQRSVDLSGFAQQAIELTLEADAGRPGTLALWAAPTVAGGPPPRRPNVIVYLIDGAGADFLSVYGYPRRTTPNLERLAAEGAVFEHAFSNSGWTKPATATLMTSLQHSVLGGFRTFSDPLPDEAVTLAEHLHRAGYPTGVFVSNPFAGRMSSLDRGVDVLRDAGTTSNSDSSARLHEDFFAWRAAYPTRPFWAHLQSTDVHSPYRAVKPFAARYLDPGLEARYRDWRQRLEAAGGTEPDSPAWEETGIDRAAFYDVEERFYAACLAHNDHQIGRLVEGLEAAGEWQNTILIVTADHGVQAAGLRRDGVAPPRRVLASAWETRIPLIVVWPGRIAPGRRHAEPVSLIDLLPTILDLADLPAAEVAQGRSLAPLLLGDGTWEPRPVILDEFARDPASGVLTGLLEAVDGRWAASLEIAPAGAGDEPARPPLLLFDRLRDPLCLHSLNGEHPELVQRYTALLRRVWKEHRDLAQRFTRSADANLTGAQLETLRSLGYLQ